MIYIYIIFFHEKIPNIFINIPICSSSRAPRDASQLPGAGKSLGPDMEKKQWTYLQHGKFRDKKESNMRQHLQWSWSLVGDPMWSPAKFFFIFRRKFVEKAGISHPKHSPAIPASDVTSGNVSATSSCCSNSSKSNIGCCGRSWTNMDFLDNRYGDLKEMDRNGMDKFCSNLHTRPNNHGGHPKSD